MAQGIHSSAGDTEEREGKPGALPGSSTNQKSMTKDIIRKIRYEAGCWIWTGRVDKNGEARIGNNNRLLFPRRIMYESVHGPLNRRHISPTCGNKCCLNPDHLTLSYNLEYKGKKKGPKKRITPNHRIAAIIEDLVNGIPIAVIRKKHKTHQMTVYRFYKAHFLGPRTNETITLQSKINT